MKPSAEAVLELLRSHPDGVTSLEALYAGCGSRLAARVAELRAEGHDVRSEYVTAPNGSRIVRYVLVPPRPRPVTGDQLDLFSAHDPRAVTRAAVLSPRSNGSRDPSAATATAAGGATG